MKPIKAALWAIGAVVSLQALPGVHATARDDALRLRSLLNELEERYFSFENQLEVRNDRAIYIQIICGVPGVGRPVDTINLPDEGAASITFAQALGKSVKLTQMARECTKDITGLEPQDVTVLPPGVNWAVLCYQDDYTFLIDGTTCNPEGKLYGCQGLMGICLQFRFWIMDAKIILSKPSQQHLASPEPVVPNKQPKQAATGSRPKVQRIRNHITLKADVEFFCPHVPLRADHQTYKFVYNVVLDNGLSDSTFRQVFKGDDKLWNQINWCTREWVPNHEDDDRRAADWVIEYLDDVGVTVKKLNPPHLKDAEHLRDNFRLKLFVVKKGQGSSYL